MTDVSNRKRQPRGVPVGGQFAANEHDEATALLVEEQDWGVLNISEGSRTPWGKADHVSVIADGIVFAGTPGHGGVKLSPERNRVIPPALRSSSGWYEEDVEYNIPAYYFPGEFASQPHITSSEEEMRASAESSIKNWFPSKWEEATGESLAPGESHEKDRETWRKVHDGDFLTTSASAAKTDPNMVVVTAVRPIDGSEGTYLVPREEYDSRRHGDRGQDGTFVIDPSRHAKLPPRSATSDPLAKKVISVSGLRDENGEAIRATGPGASRIEDDLNRRWRSRDGEVRSLRDVLEAGVVGKGAYYEGSRKKYSIEGPGSTAYPVSKATWDYLSQVPDTRPQSLIAYQELTDYERTLDRRRANYEPITAEHKAKLEKLTQSHKSAEAEEKIRRGERYAQHVASEEARERAARIEDAP